MSATVPVRATLGFAYRDVFKDLGTFAAAAWLPFIALNLVLLAASAASTTLGRTALGILEFVVWLLIGSAFAMRWHRRVLMGEPVRGEDVLRFVRRDIRAAGVTLRISVLFGIPALLLGVPLAVTLMSGGTAPRGVGAVVAVATVTAVAVSGRLMLAYPLCALDAPGGLIAAAWRMTKGNTLRLVAITLGVWLPLSVLGMIAVAALPGGAAEESESWGRALAGQLVQTAVWFLQIAVAASAASFVFRGLGGAGTRTVTASA